MNAKKVITRFTVVFLVLIFLGAAGQAQKSKVSGIVQDMVTLTGIPGANIIIAGTKLGCSTDVKGAFTIQTDTLPAYLIISHVGYESKRIWIENPSGGINILLQPAVKMLKEVEIEARNEPVPFFKDNQYSVLDYEVSNTLVYLLIYRYRIAKSELICMSDDGDTIASSGHLWFRPAKLFADCLGYIHVLSNDSSYQVFLRKDTVIFPYKADIVKFQSTMSNCIASTEDLLFFREGSIDRQTVNFYYINRENKEKQYLASVSDEASLRMLRRNPYDYYLLTMDTLPNSNLEMEEWSLVNKIFYRPNASVLEKSGDTLVIFNTTDGTFDLYNLKGVYLSGSEMNIYNTSTEKWSKEIIFDQITHLPYTYFIRNGRYIVYRIDLETGELIRVLTTSHIFPQKLRFHAGYVFYLYDLPGTADNKQLFKQYL